MSRTRIEEMLQECLTGYDAGLSPEQCLSAFPSHRQELEPLFREAISLRVAYATTPTPEFRERTRERLLFAAGRDVSAAFARQPDQEFVDRTRRRLIAASGAGVQEALRSVPPPRMPFWLNARRRLLEAAQAPRPAPRPAVSMAMRTSLSAAVIVLALAIAGLAYFTNSGEKPASVSAEYAALEQQLQEVEQAANGGTVSTAMVDDLTQRTLNLAQRLETENDPDVAQKLPNVIERQKTVVQLAASEGTLTPELEQAQARLDLADRITAARAPDGSDALAAASTSPTAEASASTTDDASASPAPTSTPPAPTPTAVPLQDGQVRVSAAIDNTFGMNWLKIETTTLRLNVPSSWKVVGVNLDASGTGSFLSDTLRIDSPDASVILLIRTDSGAIQAVLGDKTVILRTKGNHGEIISLPDLVLQAGELATELSHVTDSLVITGELVGDPEPTPTHTASPAPTETATPTSTATPAATPSASPEASATP